ncbi:amidase [Alicyclobacillaceae bacterium I2511]|nr:amidase [Alicyclobacillaceae bacterium I2511]
MTAQQHTQASPEWSDGPGLQEATVEHLQTLMEQGETTAADIVQGYLLRIAANNHAGSEINAVLEVNPDALQIAESLDAERQARGPRGPLHGIPVLLKDNIDTGDKLHTSAGSLALANSQALADAFLVEKLRQAGAIILGKANMTEWANFMTEGMPNGYSSRGGQVKNPYGPGKLDVGGSSSGSAAAVAANFVPLAVGTETSGSILSPAASNSVVGIKPTLGLVSRSGLIPIAHSQDTAGPLARTVRDALWLLAGMAGVDPRDVVTRASAPLHPGHWIAELSTDALQGKRIGVPREPFYTDLSQAQLRVMDEAVLVLQDLGAQVVDPLPYPDLSVIQNHTVLLYEFKPDLNAYLARLSAEVSAHSLQEIVEFNRQHPQQCLRYGQTLLSSANLTTGTLTESKYLQSLAKDRYFARKIGMDHVLAQHHLDALLFPSNHGAAIPAKAGYPSITVPGGRAGADGIPVGITFTGTAWSEPTLAAMAYAFEQATHHRAAPSTTQD